jgi:DNA-binding transcriptional MocR family regulator
MPSYDLLPHKELLGITKKVLNMDDWIQVEYGDVKGEKFFRQQVAYYMNVNGNSVSPDNIIVTNGASEGMALAIRAVTRPGDLILMESPSYFGFMHLLETSKVFAMEMATCPENGVDVADFYTAVKRNDVKAFLCQPNNGNPLSHVYPEEVKEEIVNICNRFDIPIIEDDINGDLTFNGKRGYNMKKYDKNGNVVYVSSFSKTLAPGFRTGWIEPGKYYDEIFRQKLANSMITNEVPQIALAHYLASGKYPRHLKRLRNKLKNQVESYTMSVLKHFPEGTKVTRPKGGFVLWVELPEKVDTMHMYELAMKEKISFSPGGIFTTQDKYNNCLRLNCGFAMTGRIEKAMHRLGEFSSSY